MTQALNPLTLPLAQTNLIEASAGTGKTWNIAALFARMILLPLPNHSQPLSIDKILVVTFTKAATAELKARLRARLDEALVALQETDHAISQPEKLRENCPDEFLFDLLQQALANETQPENAQQRVMLRLKAAISDFDNAAVYTIHSFCQRVLQDFAFLCGVPFDIELDEDSDSSQLLIAAQDFWRERIASNALYSRLLYRKYTPKNQIEAMAKMVAQPYLQIRQTPIDEQQIIDVEQKFQSMWQNICTKLPEIETTFWQIRPALNGNSFQEKTFREKFEFLHSVSGSHVAAQQIWDNLQNSSGVSPFSVSFMQSKIKKGNHIDDDKLAIVAQLDDLAEISVQLMTLEEQIIVQLHHDLLHYLREKQHKHKQSSPVRHFDDLLLDVYHALQSDQPHATALAQNMAQNWQIALIDEFQDTDPLQYAIFQAAFAQTHTPLFLVGDPKQAIYSFRGADIFAYLQAADDAANRYTLSTNRRSHQKLMNSISALFSRPQPFALPEISYQAVDAHREDTDLSPRGHALTVRWLNRDDDKKDNAEVLRKRAASYCASEIAQMLNQSEQGSLKLNNMPLRADQIAVLVRARADGALVQRELKKRNVQSVLLSRNSVFAEPEAEAIAALLDFFIQPQRVPMLRFVLASGLFDFTFEQIHELNQNESQLLQWIDSAQSCLNIWLEHGIFAAIQHFLTQHGVETRLLTQGNERTLTNLYQLMELLAQEDENSHTPTSLRQWLGQHIQATHDNESRNEHILRLESDENLVKIVTMHASKGLEYPIVFCPFAWRASGDNKTPEWQVIHHNHQAQLIHKTQLSPEDKELATQENLSEDLRLMYVATTRAREQLHLYMASYDRSDRSAFAYLLQAQDVAKNAEQYLNAWREFVAKHQSNQTDMILIDDKQTRIEHEFTPPPHRQNFQAATFAPRAYQFIRHTSFTGLSKQHQRLRENADTSDMLLPVLDNVEQMPVAPTETGNSIHHFPQGTATGLCWHGILEQGDFSQPASLQINMIDEQLTRYGFDPEIWRDEMVQLFDNVRLVPIFSGSNLAQTSPQNYLVEWGFLLHVDEFRAEDLRQWFSQPHLNLSPDIVRAAQTLNFYAVLGGFINGFVDLFYHAPNMTAVVDYKSHYLGDNVGAYHQANLDAAVAEHHYYLQALLYAIACARYLKTRHALPEKIAVRYLFLRGLSGEDGGVWQWDIATDDLARWL